MSQLQGKTSSAWNTNTWEERNVSVYAKTSLTKAITKLDNTNIDNQKYIVKIVKLTTCEGEATNSFINKRKRCGYEYHVKIDAQIMETDESQSQVVDFKIELPDVCDDVSGHKYVVNYKQLSNSVIKSVLVKEFTPIIRDSIKAFSEDLLLQ